MDSFEPKALPLFAQGVTMYQLFLRQFTPEGTLQAAEKLLPHLADLGIRILYLCPFNEADDDENRDYWSPRQIASGMNNPKNPYRINDYFRIDSEYGTDEDFASFVRVAHQLGIKVMLDIVYLHCGPRATLLSMDPDMIQRDKEGKPILGVWHFPLLNYDSPKLCEYMWGNMLYFVKKFDIDGYRCDVGGGVPLSFWEEGRRRIDAIKKDFIMLNEAPGIQADEKSAFELVYGFRHGSLLKFFKNEISPSEFRQELDDYFADGRENLRIMWYIDNHDIALDAYEERFEKTADVKQVENALAFVFAMEGMPLLYNGQEIADSNRHSLWANHEYGHHLGINWATAMTPKGKNRLAFIKRLIKLRANNRVLTMGTRAWLDLNQKDKVLGLVRTYEGNKVVCIFNAQEDVQKVSLPHIQVKKIVLNTGAEIQDISDGSVVELQGYSCVFFEIK